MNIMNKQKRTAFTSCILTTALACSALLLAGCPNTSTIILPDCEGADCFQPGRELPTPFGAFISVDRSLIVRGDASAGFATVRATANSPSLFRWSVSPSDLLDIQVANASTNNLLQTAAGSTESSLSILSVLKDPGAQGTIVEVSVAATELMACEPCTDDAGASITNDAGETIFCDDTGNALPTERNDQEAVIAPVLCAGDAIIENLTVIVRRPDGPLTVSLSPEQNTILPQSMLTLTASITGGDPFVTPSTDCSFTGSCIVPPNNGTGYCVCWALAQDASLRSGSATSQLRPNALPAPENSDEVIEATAVYTAPLETGNVVFTVTVKDAAGNQSTSVVPVVVSSRLPLGLFAFPGNPAVAPSGTSTLTATASGGTAPYQICFDTPSRGVLSPSGNPTCTAGISPATPGASVDATRQYTAPTVAGNDTIRITVTDDVGDTRSDVISLNISEAAGRACGDSVTQPPEQCDDGNLAPGDGCSPSCNLEGCGNGIVEPGEQCDDGGLNANTADSCRTNCKLAVCGDSINDSNEGCDDGNFASGDGCSPTCNTEVCGNGNADPNEECDDGANNANAADACRLNCTLPACGDGITDSNEGCDDGNALSGDGCSPTCILETCGNGVADPDEQCDDGGNNSNTTPDACRVNCTLPRCGDGVTDAGEECDDGNIVSGDGCSPTCIQQLCGNGITDPGEQCDDGLNNSDVIANACRTTCVLPSCGDSVTDSNEQCDDGNTSNTDDCTNACENNVCGDGFRDTQGPVVEACDDGNDINTDACLNSCQVASCGDGFTRVGVEVCDEGLGGNDGGEGECIAGCGAIQTCGDGTTNGTESCDDEYTDACGSCNATCSGVGSGSTCGDGNLCPQNEACDDGDIDACGICNSLCTGSGIPDTGACDDGSACTSFDTCQSGVCVSGTAVDCTGFTTACSNFECNPNAAPNNCSTALPINEGGMCDDGLFCTDVDTCGSGVCIGSSSPCLAGETCDEGLNVCVP